MSTNRKRKFPDSVADEKIKDETTIVQTTPHLNDLIIDTNMKIQEIDNEIGEVKKKIDEVELEIKEIKEGIKTLENKEILSDRDEKKLDRLYLDKDKLQDGKNKHLDINNKLLDMKNKLLDMKNKLRKEENLILEENIILLKARTAKGPPNPITHQFSSGSHSASPCSRTKYKQNFAYKFANEVQTFSIFAPQVKVFVRFQNAQPFEGSTEDIISLMTNNCKALDEDFKKIEGLILVNESSSSNSLNCDFTKLRSMVEEEFQDKHLNKFRCKRSLDEPHQNHKCTWLDTHNKAHKTICVSLVDSTTGMVTFNAKPDLVSCHVPLYVDVKKYGCEMAHPETLHECDFELLYQGIERVTQVFQFRGYLSKFMVVLSNGVHSFFMLYQHIIDDAHHNPRHSFQLHIIPIDTKSINNLVTRIIEAARSHGPGYYLTPHGALILNALKSMVPHTVSVYQVRVQYLTSSRHSLYFITEPEEDGNVKATTKSYVFKVNLDLGSYYYELNMLKRLGDKRFLNFAYNYKPGFELRRSYTVEEEMPRATGRHVWFESIPPVCVTGGILATTAGVRSINYAPHEKLNYRIIMKDLHNHLQYIHSKGLLHTDIRPDNIVYFPEVGWRIIDFDCAVFASQSVDIQKDSSRYDFSSNRVKHLGKNIADRKWYKVTNYSIDDDIEMLHNAVKKIFEYIVM